MEDKVISAYTPVVRDGIFSAINVSVGDVTDLGGFENFVYGYGHRVIRVTHNSHRTRDQLLGELEFMRFLHAGGGAVAKPLELGEQGVLSVGDFYVCQFERATGKRASEEIRFSDTLIREWGRCIGQFHRLTSRFQPQYTRQNWQTDENHQFPDRIPGDQVLVLAQAANLMERLSTFEMRADRYGLIHSDAHVGNFFNDEGRLTFIDFDDSLYTWFAYDVATILLGVALQPWVDDNDDAMARAVRHFLPVFVDGYATEYDPGCLMWDRMHEFIRLREFSLYAVIHAQLDPDYPADGFVGKFMRNRQQRLEQGIPYVDIDFQGLIFRD